MSVQILSNADDTTAALYCSTSDWAFGPLFHAGRDCGARENALAFLNWLDDGAEWHKYENGLPTRERDPRSLSDNGLESAYADWLATPEKASVKS